MSPIDLRIDRLVLEGLVLAPGDAQRLGTAVERELSRMLGEEGGLAASSAHIGRVVAPSVALSPDGGVDVWGHQIARAIHGSIRTVGGEGGGR